MQKNQINKLGVTIICVMILLAGAVQIQEIKASAETQIVLSPSPVSVEPGDNFTIMVNATNVVSLSAWQLVLKFNLTIMNVTTIWIPTANIFAGYQTISVAYVFGVDAIDHMGYVLYGSSLLLDTVTSSNGILCMVNCTAFQEGTTTLLVATVSDRAHPSVSEYDAFYSFLLDENSMEMEYAEKSASVLVGGILSKPIAKFSVIVPIPDNSTQLVLYSHPPVGDVVFYQTFVGMPVLFNASASFGVTKLQNGTTVQGNIAISRYIWDFGVTDEPAVSTDNPVINYTYQHTGDYKVKLTVEDKENPPAQSAEVSYLMYVGMALDYFNWGPFVYTVFALIAAGLAYYLFRETRKYWRERKTAKAQKLLMERARQKTEPS